MRRPRRPAILGLAVVLALQLMAGLGAVAVRHGDAPPPVARVPTSRAVGNAAVAPAPVDPRAERAAAVDALLQQRSSALRDRDRAAFLDTLDPQSPDFVSAQAALFDRLAAVPIGQWDYRLDPDREQAHSGTAFARYGGAPLWLPDVALRFTLAGFDDHPTIQAQHFTFVQRPAGWRLASDSDVAGTGDPTPRNLWDTGPVVSVRSDDVLVLGHPASLSVVRQVAAETASAIPRVTAVWGTRWSQKVVVLVPQSQDELAAILGGNRNLTRIAAVATAEVLDEGLGRQAVGDRVLVNPPTFGELGALGRRVVLTHEVTHVASRQASGPHSPTWLVEGLADYVGYRDTGLAVRSAARELAVQVRRGDLPTALPADGDYDGGNGQLAQVYEMSWLAVRLIVDTYGEDKMLAFYRAAGADRADAVDVAFRDVLGTTAASFTAAWRADLAAELG